MCTPKKWLTMFRTFSFAYLCIVADFVLFTLARVCWELVDQQVWGESNKYLAHNDAFYLLVKFLLSFSIYIYIYMCLDMFASGKFSSWLRPWVYCTIAYRSAFFSIGLCQNLQPFYKAIALVYICFYLWFVIYWHFIGDNRHWLKVQCTKICFIPWVTRKMV